MDDPNDDPEALRVASERSRMDRRIGSRGSRKSEPLANSTWRKALSSDNFEDFNFVHLEVLRTRENL
jgi:hypothetical protein